MSPVKYYTIMRKSKDPRWIRYEMVGYAKEKGVKPAVRAFNTTPKTVRKWLSWRTKAKLPRIKNQGSIRTREKKRSN